MNLSLYISELLIKNNCVIVPNFGGFIANYESAVIDKVRNKIYPPSKNVLFNPNLLSNDGLLANYVSIKINKPYSNALKLIDSEVIDWKSILNAGERINLGEIGFLYQKEGIVKFEQNREFNLLLSAYGLSSVKFISQVETVEPISSEVNAEKIKKGSETKVIEFAPSISVEKDNKKENENPEIFRKTKSKKWKYIAVACMLPLLFYSYWIPMNTHFLDTGNVQMADFNPLQEKASKIYSTRINKIGVSIQESINEWSEIAKNINSDVKYYNFQFDDELYIPVDLKFEKKSNQLELGTIHLIAGCFSNKTNAKSLVKDLKSKGHSAVIIDKNNGLYRVSAESFNKMSEAKLMKQKLTDASISTWVLNK
jgi:hypothetical protein